MNRLLTPVFLLAFLAVILPGCASSGEMLSRGLKGTLTGIERASDGTVTATWRVTNTNINAYLFSRVTHKIYLEGVYLGKIVNDNPAAIPAGADVDRSGKITLGDAASTRVLAEAIARGSANYRVDSQVVVGIYDEVTEKTELIATGVVPVTAK